MRVLTGSAGKGCSGCLERRKRARSRRGANRCQKHVLLGGVDCDGPPVGCRPGPGFILLCARRQERRPRLPDGNGCLLSRHISSGTWRLFRAGKRESLRGLDLWPLRLGVLQHEAHRRHLSSRTIPPFAQTVLIVDDSDGRFRLREKDISDVLHILPRHLANKMKETIGTELKDLPTGSVIARTVAPPAFGVDQLQDVRRIIPE